MSAPTPASGRLASSLLVALPLIALAPQIYLILHSLYARDTTVFGIGFGFGDYVRNLHDRGVFQSCSALPFRSCHPGLCVNATRMPGLPLLYTGIASVVGLKASSVAIAKCCLVALLLGTLLWLAARDFHVGLGGVLLLYPLYLGPQPLKHAATLEYEECLLLGLFAALAITLVYLVRPGPGASDHRRPWMAVAAIAIATAMYFTKSSTMLVLVVVATLVLVQRGIPVAAKLASLGIIALPLAAWVHHTASTSGGLHLSSSWNGENLLRGYSADVESIYPEISPDREFDSDHALLLNGVVVPLGDLTRQRCFDDEWAWNDYYAAAARRWALDHPLDALRFDLTKARVALLEIRHTPTFVSATDKTPLYTPALAAAMAAWMLYARVLFYALLATLLLGARHRGGRWRLWLVAVLAAAVAPYIIAFAFERHVVPALVAAGCMLVLTRFARPRHLHEP
ncbi:MAG TPA: hypothetical protein VMB48_17060 [Steroidobacteraceae bacterium]|nr:hypothetical protein [Steroidobacteraceae bacterium]